MANGKSKEGVKTEKSDHINLKVVGQDGSVVQFKIKRHTPLSKLTRAYWERQTLSMRQIGFRFDGQRLNETDTPAQLAMEHEDAMICSSCRQEVSTGKGACCFTPEFCYRPRTHSQSESHNLVLPHPDYSSLVFSPLSFPWPHFFIGHKVTCVCA